MGLQLAPDLVWKKVDGARASELLAGSEWTLTPVVAAGGTPPSGTWPRVITDCVATGCSGADLDPTPGVLRLRGVPWGTYDLVETKAPEGFVLAPAPIRVVIGAGGLNRTEWRYELGSVSNVRPGVDVSWEKVDPASQRLAGSSWEFIPVDDAGVAVPGATVLEVSDCVADLGAECEGNDHDPVAGRFRLSNIAPGTYHLVETRAPAGFVRLTDPILVTVAGDTAVQLGQITNEQIAVPPLPLTGGVGSFLFILGGGAFLGLAALSAARHLRFRRTA